MRTDDGTDEQRYCPCPTDLLDGDAPLEAAGDLLVAQLARGADLRRVVAEEGELLHRAEERGWDGRGRRRAPRRVGAQVAGGRRRGAALGLLRRVGARRLRGRRERLPVELLQHRALLGGRAPEERLPAAAPGAGVDVRQAGEEARPLVRR